jgi:hypothetical protein
MHRAVAEKSAAALRKKFIFILYFPLSAGYSFNIITDFKAGRNAILTV